MQSCKIDITNVKDEFSANRSSISFCQACLSTDRALSSLTEYADIFYKICDLQNVSPPTEGYLCWECITLLKKIRKFAKMVADAQELLQVCYLSTENPFPHSLSNLTITQQDPTTFVYEPIVQLIKIELDPEISDNDDSLDHAVDETIPDVKQEPDDVPEAESRLDNRDIMTESVINTVKNSNRRSEEAIMKGYLKYRTRRAKYRYINTNLRKHRSFVMKKISIGVEEAMSMLEEERCSSVFLSAAHKCVSCVEIMDNEQELLDHNKKFHDVSAGRFVCNVCQTRCLTPDVLSSHVSSHGVCRQCRACAWRGVSSGVVREHVEEHHNMTQCTACLLLFKNSRIFYYHYRAIHKIFVCDVCGKRCKSRDKIVKHLRRHTHRVYECPFCKKLLKTSTIYEKHLETQHNNPYPDEAYCVSCDRRFKCELTYQLHLRWSRAHAQERNEGRCSDCDKTYARKKTMMLHYNMVHLKKSKYHCNLCDKCYSLPGGLRTHQRQVHEKRPKPKNNLCKYCGRGFYDKRVLVNHIRTHTGERPFVCSHCSAAFTQKQALQGHMKKAHK